MVCLFQDLEGNTPLHYAVCRKEKERGRASPKDRDRVALLLKHLAVVNSKNCNGSTPLHLTSDAEIARMLLDAGADPNCPDAVGANTPLHVAVKGRHKDIVRLMLRSGADVSLANAAGKTPLNLAKDKEMKNILLRKDSSTSNSSGASTSSTSSSSSTSVFSNQPVPAKRKKVAKSAYLEELAAVVAPACTSPGILKRRRNPSSGGEAGDAATTASAENTTTTAAVEEELDSSSRSPSVVKRCRRSGPRLRFSDVNDYSGVEVVEEVRRVKVTPIYSEPTFSSDEEEFDEDADS